MMRICALALLVAGAITLGPASAAAAGATPAAATPVQREQAQGRFAKGRDLYLAKKYEAAAVELRASLDIVASPNTRLLLGRALREAGQTVAAYVEFGRASVEAKELVREDSRYDKAASAAEGERADLARGLGFVDVQVEHASPSTVLRVAGDEVRRGGWQEPIPVLPGTTEVLADTPGREPIRRSVTLAAGERTSLVLDAQADTAAQPPAPPATGRPASSRDATPALRPLAFMGAGVSAAGLATFLVAGTLANGTYSDLEDACGSGPCPAARQGDVSAGKSQQTVANVGLAVFAVAGALAATLFVIDAKRDKPRTARAIGPRAMFLQGAF